MNGKLLTTLTILLLSLLSFDLAGANIVDMGSFNLPTMTLINKYDFSYGDGDGDEDLEDAAIRFDLAFVP